MKMLAARAVVSLFLLAGVLSFAIAPSLAQQTGPQVINEDHHDTSPPLKSLPQIPATPNIVHEVPLGYVRLPLVTNQPDPVRQSSMAGPLVSTTPGLSFDGIPLTGAYPPDPNASVGATQVVQIVNFEYAVYNKANGALELGPAQINSLWF